MITFEDDDSQVILNYSPDQPLNWLDSKLSAGGTATLARVFHISERDLIEAQNDDTRRFVIGHHQDQYRVIRKGVLNLKYDLMIDFSIPLFKSTFVAERNISIFKRIDDLVSEQIVVGGAREGAIPLEEFAHLLKRFPNSTELRRYADARVTRILGEYFGSMTDAEKRLTGFISRRERSAGSATETSETLVPAAITLEREKFTFVRDRLFEMLRSADGYTEANWQKVVADLFLLIYPQYIAVLNNVQVQERYSRPGITNRFIDLVLVRANGTIDIIEIKKPFERGLVTKRQYRGNHIPVRELSGSIMQAEKYIFYLGKSGPQGEEHIQTKYSSLLPPGMEVRISNPKAIILAGRDNNLSSAEIFDLEFIKRKYSNIVDILSYDDLLRRVENVINMLDKRSVAKTDSS